MRVCCIWSDIRHDGARRKQIFSFDAGATWTSNWVMQLSRTG